MKPVYTAADLAELPANARLGVVGNPIAHSISPPMQQAALDAEELPFTYVRLLCEREAGAFPAFVAALRRAGFIGVNVTVPFKKEAYAVANEADTLSRLCGAANTLVFAESGIACYNTDGPGFSRAVQELCGRPLCELRVALLGACGGAGSALAAQCALEGCPQLTLVNRPRPELALLADTLRPHAPATHIHTASFDDVSQYVATADLVVNATSIGLSPTDASPIDPHLLRPGQFVYDIVTHPTALTRAAGERGCAVSTGHSMLLYQGVYAYAHWFHHLPPVDPMRAALAAIK